MISDNFFRKTITLLMAVLLVFALAGCGKAQSVQAAKPAESSGEAGVQPFTKVRHAEITVKDYGTETLEMHSHQDGYVRTQYSWSPVY